MPLLFLSHSGVDADGARAVKRRILEAAAPEWHVWFDKDDLEAGRPWQVQIEDAIARSAAFVVYVGTGGVVNFVDAEVRVALARAIVEPDYRFIPLLANSAPGPDALPGFARQFQCVTEAEFDKLLDALRGRQDAGVLRHETNPFFALAAIDESRSHLFFGRDDETNELVQRVFEQSLVLVSGDSGSGKSSLVRAGLVSKFRGGAMALLKDERPGDRIWHVVITRPRGRPWAELGDAVSEAARPLGMSVSDRDRLAEKVASKDPEAARRALRCDLPADRTSVLLVVDQFEELFTTTPEAERVPFVDFLLNLAADPDQRFRVVLTMRHDYTNLCSGIESLRARLEADGRRARFALGPMSGQGLTRIVTEPLRLARVSETDRSLLAKVIREEVGSRAGDLALVQMALTETWRARTAHHGDLLAAYADVGRVEGALAKAAEQVRQYELQRHEHRELAAALDPVLLRLVRLGDTGGATRRQATKDEFDDVRWRLIQFLAGDDGKRLVLVGGSADRPTAEIAHEALVTAWPYFQNLLQSVAEQKRVLDDLIPKAKLWAAADANARESRLASGLELQQFARLASKDRDWLSATELGLVAASQAHADRQRNREVFVRRAARAVAVAFAAGLAFVSWQYLQTQRALERANSAVASSLWNRLDFTATASGGLFDFVGSRNVMSSDELNALWELRDATPELRTAFLDELRSKPERAVRLGRRPAPVIRALFLDWPPARAEVALNAVLKELEATDLSFSIVIGAAAAALSEKVTNDQAMKAWETIVGTMRRSSRPNLGPILKPALETLARRMTGSQVDATFTTVLNAVESGAPGSEPLLSSLAPRVSAQQANEAVGALLGSKATEQKRSALRPVGAALAARLTDAQASARFEDLQRAMKSPSDSSLLPAWLTFRSAEYATLGGALLQKVTPTQVEQAFGSLLQRFLNSTDPAEALASARFISALRDKISDSPSADVQPAVRKAIAMTTASERQVGILLVQVLAPKLTETEVDEAFRLVVESIEVTSEPARLRDLGSHAVVFAKRMTAKQFEAAAPGILTSLRNVARVEQRATLATILSAVADRLSSGHAEAGFRTLVESLGEAKDEAKAIRTAAIALSGRFTVSQRDISRVLQLANTSPQEAQRASLVLVGTGASAAMTPEQAEAMLDLARPLSITSALPELRGALATLAGRLTESQVRTALDALLKALRGAPGRQHPAIADDALALSERLTPAQADEVLGALVVQIDVADPASSHLFRYADAAVAVSSRLDSTYSRVAFGYLLGRADRLENRPFECIADIAASVASRLGPEEASKAFPLVVKAIGIRDTPPIRLGESLELLAMKLAPGSRKNAIAEAQALLGWSRMDFQRAAAAKTLVKLWASDETDQFVRSIVEVLGYPTATDEATDVLLEALQARAPQAPGRQAGLQENIHWIARTYPRARVDLVPVCPPARWPGLACPAAGR